MPAKKKIFLFVIVAIAAFVLAIATGYLFWGTKHSEDYADSSIVKVEPSDNEEMKDSTDVSLQYAGYVTLLSDEKNITLNFTNPSRSKKSLSLEIVANINGDNITLAKSDIIHPGYKINNIKYKLNREIPKGNYVGKFVVYFYGEQDKKEIVNTEIKINIYVK